MNGSEFRAQLEEELSWRLDEILFFQNRCVQIHSESEQDKFRRALVLLLYSNFEGYCKFALSLYVSAVNQEGVDCVNAQYAIAAASMHDIFAALRDGTKKAPEFRNDLPDDTGLHRFARDREFLERANEIMKRKIVIPESAVDLESNLKPVVLRKNLYRVGLPHDQFDEHEKDISKLLSLRNKIAHGETKQGIPSKLYEELRGSALKVMTGIAVGMTKAFVEKWYIRRATA